MCVFVCVCVPILMCCMAFAIIGVGIQKHAGKCVCACGYVYLHILFKGYVCVCSLKYVCVCVSSFNVLKCFYHNISLNTVQVRYASVSVCQYVRMPDIVLFRSNAQL